MKKIWLLLFAAVLVLCSCETYTSHIDDLNGENDFSLCKLNERQLLTDKPHVLKQNAVLSQNGGNVSFSVKKMSGVEVLYSLTAKSGDVCTVTADTSCISGNLRLFWWHDGNIIKDIPVNEPQSFKMTFKESGKYELRAAAESANFTADIACAVD